jgi:hypothetical protein
MKLDTTVTEDYKFIGFETTSIQLEYLGILTFTNIKGFYNSLLILER